jgi:hypothetical protein
MKLLENSTQEELIQIIYTLRVENFKNLETIKLLKDEIYLLEKENLLQIELIENTPIKPLKKSLFQRFIEFFTPKQKIKNECI